MGLHRASGRPGQSVHPYSRTGRSHPRSLVGWSVASAVAKSFAPVQSLALSSRSSEVDGGRIAVDMCRVAGRATGRIRLRRHRFGRASIAFVAYRTPVLYSRNQSRTNTVLLMGMGSTCRADLYVLEMEKDKIAKLASTR